MKTADNAVYLFTQNYTQSVIAVYWRNNGSIVNVNIL